MSVNDKITNNEGSCFITTLIISLAKISTKIGGLFRAVVWDDSGSFILSRGLPSLLRVLFFRSLLVRTIFVAFVEV